ncbi:MAG: extracellular solute-binding protein, partial [Gemmataceae bacterium]
RLAPSSLDNWIFRDRYGITYPDAVMTLGYNRTRMEKAPSRWVDLLRPDLAGKLGLYQSYYMSLYTFACILVDREGHPGTAVQRMRTHLDEVIRFARDHRDKVKLWWPTSTDMILALSSGECVAGNMHSPEFLQALREKPELGAAVPDTDRAFVQVFWAIPAGSPNKQLAERAIDILFSEEVQLGFARHGSATSLLSVAETMSEEDSLWKQLYPHTPQQFLGLRYYPYELYEQQGNELADEWDRTILRKS